MSSKKVRCHYLSRIFKSHHTISSIWPLSWWKESFDKFQHKLRQIARATKHDRDSVPLLRDCSESNRQQSKNHGYTRSKCYLQYRIDYWKSLHTLSSCFVRAEAASLSRIADCSSRLRCSNTSSLSLRCHRINFSLEECNCLEIERSMQDRKSCTDSRYQLTMRRAKKEVNLRWSWQTKFEFTVGNWQNVHPFVVQLAQSVKFEQLTWAWAQKVRNAKMK